MLKILAIIALILSLGISDARLPQEGDHVKIASKISPLSTHIEYEEGNVTGFGNGIICIDECYCLGTEYIYSVTLLDNSPNSTI